jgi:purine-binding chemotaxis protein CheW
MASASGRAEAELTLACFRVGAQVIALDVAQLREVVRWQDPTPLPGAPDLIEGVIELRGSVVPVVDLGRALGSEPVCGGPRARVVVVEAEGLLFGLAVDAALEVTPGSQGALVPPPELATRAGFSAGRALLRRQGSGPALVLSLEHILERVRGGSAEAQETRA